RLRRPRRPGPPRTTSRSRRSRSRRRTCRPRPLPRPASGSRRDGMAPYPLDRLDDRLGDVVERAIRSHHRRRLGRHGHAGALEPPGDPAAPGWAATGSFAPTAGNRIELLVDGADALPRIAAEIAAAR